MGVSIRFCSFEGANENVWHILEVHPSSPAEIAGLCSFTDYIIAADSVLHDNEDLFALIEAHEGRSLKLYVYNSVEDVCREVNIIPNSSWGGEGSIGCGIGYGYLHRIPIRGNSSEIITPSNLNLSEKPSIAELNKINIPESDNLSTINSESTTNANINSNLIHSEINAPMATFNTPQISSHFIPPNPNINLSTPFMSPSPNISNLNSPFIPTNLNNLNLNSTEINQPFITSQNNQTTDFSQFSNTSQESSVYLNTNIPYPPPPLNVHENFVPSSENNSSNVLTSPNSTQNPSVNLNYLNQYVLTNPMLYNPDIAARSAQQLISGDQSLS